MWEKKSASNRIAKSRQKMMYTIVVLVEFIIGEEFDYHG